MAPPSLSAFALWGAQHHGLHGRSHLAQFPLLPHDDHCLHQALLQFGQGRPENIWDCSMVKHIALLLFTNCILYCPVAFLSFSSLLNLTFISPEVIKFILLVIVPLPACLNPLLYILFNPHFKEDLVSLGKQTYFWTRSKHPSLMSINSDDVEKQSCDSTQALVTFTSSSIAYDLPPSSVPSPAYPVTESCHLSSVAFVPCL